MTFVCSEHHWRAFYKNSCPLSCYRLLRKNEEVCCVRVAALAAGTITTFELLMRSKSIRAEGEKEKSRYSNFSEDIICFLCAYTYSECSRVQLSSFSARASTTPSSADPRCSSVIVVSVIPPRAHGKVLPIYFVSIVVDNKAYDARLTLFVRQQRSGPAGQTNGGDGARTM